MTWSKISSTFIFPIMGRWNSASLVYSMHPWGSPPRPLQEPSEARPGLQLPRCASREGPPTSHHSISQVELFYLLAPAASRYASSRGTCLVSRCPTGCRTRTRTIRSRTRALRCRRVRIACTRPAHGLHTACTRPAHGLHMPCTCRAHYVRVHVVHMHVPCACACCMYLPVRGAALRKVPRALRQGHAAGEHHKPARRAG